MKANGTFSRANIFRFMRSSETKKANNAVRTALLGALGNAFGLNGMQKVDGKMTFSREFMDNLERILGPSFKRTDFGVKGAGGVVASGKPLTSRRISAIMKQAVIAGRGDFSVDVYREKLEYIMQELDTAENGSSKGTLQQHSQGSVRNH